MVKFLKPVSRSHSHHTKLRRVLLADGHSCFSPHHGRGERRNKARSGPRFYLVFLLLALIVLLNSLLPN